MGIMQEIEEYGKACCDDDYEKIKTQLGNDSWNKVGAIFRILEIGSPNIAHSKLLLHVCEDMLEKCSTTVATSRDA